MARRRNHSPQKKKKNPNSIQDSWGREENGYLVPYLTQTMTNGTGSPVTPHKTPQRGNFVIYH
jgi:hypothetical protein